MRIDRSNAPDGNRAMSAVLLLYYHLMREGGFTHAQTVYLDPDDFDPATWIAVEVDADLQPEIDPALIREGAAICLLCDLSDMIEEFGETFALQPFTKKLLAVDRDAVLAAVPESEQIFAMVETCGGMPDGLALREALAGIFQKYVRARFLAIASAKTNT